MSSVTTPDFAKGIKGDDTYSNIAPNNSRKTLILVNNFIANTVDFMNKFSSLCEQRLTYISQQTDRLDVLMDLLETKLESVPLNENDTQVQATTDTIQVQSTEISTPAPPTDRPPPDPQQAAAQLSAQQAEAAVPASVAVSPPPPAAVPIMGPAQGPVKDDPRYARYFMMLARGIPKPAVIQKLAMESEGSLDATVLDLDPETPFDLPSLNMA